MTPYFHNVQALRGVACLLVVAFHLRIWDKAFGRQTPGYGVVDYFGYAAVDVFFVLSGFIITTTNRKYFGRTAAVPGYMFRRAWRVYPIYWAAAAFCAAAAWLLVGSNPFDPDAVRQLPEVLALAPLAGLNPLIPQAWTLTYELMFYAAFGAFLLLPARAAAAGLAVWAAVVAAALLAPAPADPWAALPVSPFVFEFLGGCLIAWLTARGKRGGARAAAVVALAWTAAGVVVVASGPAAFADAIHGVRLRVLVYGPPAVLLVYAAAAVEGRWPRRVPRSLVLAGDASYSLYLTHNAVILAALFVGMKIPHTRLPHVAGLAAAFAATLAVGLLFYALVERPLQNLWRRRRRAEPPAAPPEAVPTRRAA